MPKHRPRSYDSDESRDEREDSSRIPIETPSIPPMGAEMPAFWGYCPKHGRYPGDGPCPKCPKE